jgi:hypothetical protein
MKFVLCDLKRKVVYINLQVETDSFTNLTPYPVQMALSLGVRQ